MQAAFTAAVGFSAILVAASPILRRIDSVNAHVDHSYYDSHQSQSQKLELAIPDTADKVFVLFCLSFGISGLIQTLHLLHVIIQLRVRHRNLRYQTQLIKCLSNSDFARRWTVSLELAGSQLPTLHRAVAPMASVFIGAEILPQPTAYQLGKVPSLATELLNIVWTQYICP